MTPSRPRVSVITATYNRSNVLRCAIESVLLQTFRDFEMLVVGDGCTDDSGDVVASFGDGRLFWHNLPRNFGNQFAPNNAGLALARGEFIAYLGHDDLWLPDHLATLVEALENQEADFAHSWIDVIAPEENSTRVVRGVMPAGGFERGLVLPPSSWMHTRSLWNEIGDWKDYRLLTIAPDQDFLLRVFDHGKKIASVRRVTVLRFRATQRPNCYLEQPCHEQVHYLQRIKSEPDFLESELLDILESKIRQHPREILRLRPTPGARPGESVTTSRIKRGLAPEP